MFKLAMFVVLSVLYSRTQGSGISDGDFQCYPNRTIHFTNPNPSLYSYFTAFYVVAGTRTNCSSSADTNNENIFFQCAVTTGPITAYFSDRTLSEDFILGGTALSYTFTCMPQSNYNETVSEDLNVSINQTDESSTPTYNITAGFFSSPGVEVTSAEVGETVYFVITGPSEYDLVPLECNATGTGGEYKTVIRDGCTTDSSLLLSFDLQSGTLETDYNSTLYVFKFYNSNTLTVTCNVKVCVTGSCPYSCGTGRKRRAISHTDKTTNDDIKTANIGKSLTIIENALGGSEQATGSIIVTMVMSMLVGFVKM